jgi:hypothetical protein
MNRSSSGSSPSEFPSTRKAMSLGFPTSTRCPAATPGFLHILKVTASRGGCSHGPTCRRREIR